LQEKALKKRESIPFKTTSLIVSRRFTINSVDYQCPVCLEYSLQCQWSVVGTELLILLRLGNKMDESFRYSKVQVQKWWSGITQRPTYVPMPGAQYIFSRHASIYPLENAANVHPLTLVTTS
jgi:hypothetical protein